MWAAICDAITKETNRTFLIDEKTNVNGGDINLAFKVAGKLNDQPQQYFVKLNDKDKLGLFIAECENLKRIKNLSTIACTKVVCLGTTLDKSFLVLQYEHFAQPNDILWFELGVQLAELHQSTSHGQFGWFEDNYIGTTIQPNRWQTNWRSFFCEQRIAWQLQLLTEKSVILGDIAYIVSICKDLLAHHQVSPCLVHGDLWQGNVGFIDQQPIIYDPACYFGDREVDIAMTELFGQFPAAFYRGYQHTYPLPMSYEHRKVVYNFYHILNHLNMFKGAYIEQAQSALHRIIALHQSL
ncbi:MAG: fructosamine kinase family protein [Thalassotalea sp.]